MKKYYSKMLVGLSMAVLIITSCGVSNNDTVQNEPAIKMITQNEYEELKGKSTDEITEEERIQMSNYEELVISKQNSTLPTDYLAYVEENYEAIDSNILDAYMYTDGNISVAIFFNVNGIGIYGDKEHKDDVKNEINRVLNYYDDSGNSKCDENFLDNAESEKGYVYTDLGNINIRASYSDNKYDIFISEK